MLRLSELRLDLDHTEEDLERAILRCLRVSRERLISQHLVKRSIDARRRDRIRLMRQSRIKMIVRPHSRKLTTCSWHHLFTGPLKRLTSVMLGDRRHFVMFPL